MIERDGKFIVGVAFDTAEQALDFDMHITNGWVPASALNGAEVVRLRASDVARDASNVSMNVASHVSGPLTQVANVEGKFTR